MSADEGDVEVLARLFEVIAGRVAADPKSSYTAKLFAEGTGAIAGKVGEEAVEIVTAALIEGRDRVIAESADLIYHLMVLWADQGVAPADVWAELARREGTSGLAEKAARKKKD